MRLADDERTLFDVILLAADRVYLLRMSPYVAVSSYLTRFALTRSKSGGLVSVALSLGSPPVAVSNCHVLRCPDFPLVQSTSGRLKDCSLYYYIKESHWAAVRDISPRKCKVGVLNTITTVIICLKPISRFVRKSCTLLPNGTPIGHFLLYTQRVIEVQKHKQKSPQRTAQMYA